jgi:hypothetical protein
MCILMEKVVNCRLMWFLEKFDYFTPVQNGFRRNRSIINNLLTIKNEIVTSIKKQAKTGDDQLRYC